MRPSAGARRSGLLIAAHEVLSILPVGDAHGVGIYSQTSADIGYAWTRVNVSLGPSLSLYTMPVCGVTICERVVGVAPGGHAQLAWYFAGPMGAAVSANLDWAGGDSLVLRGGPAVMVTARPILRVEVRLK